MTMNNRISISSNEINVAAELNNTETAKKMFEGLPFSANANTWGDEIYFTVPVESELENGVEIVEVGTLAYWPPGNAFCIFFGLTPASTGSKTTVYSPPFTRGADSSATACRAMRSTCWCSPCIAPKSPRLPTLIPACCTSLPSVATVVRRRLISALSCSI